ncbi:MAG: hypothetical protein F6K08_31780 [Okeania sp. SIO1H6]|uniref:Uncharacterized protein n=1 Tax=Okeania hirsuta TaxID=1458930 RepID=A0A3N6PLD7_9CYAN|nr:MULTISPECIES: Uma2 family endonuclease [unclassified Okeania]NET17068.1 hypothetical protein [Okeania sp. SIO1H6]RQH21129.1 hypothetical protein D4Z78_10025 [Okeania hirsuta]NES79109.1 hypothetical protein [Okeania sp. SIO1H4]NET20048.1 hypothetical protein [Okeania sp. SIO1H5]NET75556.1 hypothetical protein [Okeania sp. SIO1F9]
MLKTHRSGIEDYWVLDIKNRQLYVDRESTQKGYQREMILTENDSIIPLRFSDCVVQVAQMLRPVS